MHQLNDRLSVIHQRALCLHHPESMITHFSFFLSKNFNCGYLSKIYVSTLNRDSNHNQLFYYVIMRCSENKSGFMVYLVVKRVSMGK